MNGEELKRLLLEVLQVPDLLALAQQYEVHERQGQLDVVGFLLSLILNGGSHEGGRQIDVLRMYLDQGYPVVKRSAFYERFDGSVLKLLEHMLERAVKSGLAVGAMLPGILSGVTDWRIYDSTTIRLPRGSVMAFSGTGDYSAIKVHKCYSLGKGNLVSYKLTPAREHDSLHLSIDETLRGYGILFDLGYVSLQRLLNCETHGVEYVCRLKDNWKPTVTRLVKGTCTVPLDGNQDFDLLLGTDVLLLDGQDVDADVLLGRGNVVVAARLIGIHTPKGYCFFLTSLPRVSHAPVEVGDVYRCRWDIEVDNAVDKEGARLDEIGASRANSIKILILASMLSSTIARAIVQKEKLAIREGKRPEEPAERPPLHAILLMKALGGWYRRITEMLLEKDTSILEWNRTMSRLRVVSQDINWRRTPSVLDRILGLTAPPLPSRNTAKKKPAANGAS